MKYLIVLFFVLFSKVNAQPIEVIVSASAGGPADTISRRISQIIENNSNNNLIVLNKSGAAHTIAYNYIMNSNKPTIILTTPEVQKHPVYQQLNTVVQLGVFSIYVFSNTKSSLKTRQDVEIESSKREITFGHSGHHTYSYIGLQEMCSKINCLPVGYKSGSEGILGVLGGHVDLYALVSYGSKSFLENKNLNLVTTLRNKNNYLTIFSKNIPEEKVNEIKNVIQKNIDKNFLKDMGLEVN
jgi:tripartite-type tricarboxylate transporter receptor subunit TctC